MQDELRHNQKLAKEIIDAVSNGQAIILRAMPFNPDPELGPIEIWEPRDGQLVHVKTITPQERRNNGANC